MPELGEGMNKKKRERKARPEVFTEGHAQKKILFFNEMTLIFDESLKNRYLVFIGC
jgi:hypothetical protein